MHVLYFHKKAKRKNKIRRAAGLNSAISYMEQPSIDHKAGSPFGDNSAHALFTMFTAGIIEANVRFIR